MSQIEDFIPYGHENKISREMLVIRTGLSDRIVRSEIETARKIRHILIVPDDGYFRPRKYDKTDGSILRTFIAQEDQRVKTLEENVDNYKQMARDFFRDDDQIPGQLTWEF